MRRQSSRGFTLIELMIVVMIIGIFAAVAIPQLIENSRSNELTDMTNMVEQTFAEARNIAMKTRRAVTVEMLGNQIWVNRLEGADCWSDIERYCTLDWGQGRSSANAPAVLNLGASGYADANAYLCEAEIAEYNDSSRTCSSSMVQFQYDSGAAICYSGRGELWYRNGTGTNVDCPTPPAIPAGSPDDRTAWTRSCIYINNGTIELNGAVLRLNRIDTGGGTPSDCSTGDVLDVVREVRIPFGGSPYSEVPQ